MMRALRKLHKSVLLSFVVCAGCTNDAGIHGTENAEQSRSNMSVTTTVELETGLLRGELLDSQGNMKVYRGIPYAKPPVGPLRFRAPEPVPAWHGERSATEFSAACWQEDAIDAFVWSRQGFVRSEDCLYLNVWSTATDREQKLPVMVWFHGGSHTTGYGHTALFDGVPLASRGVVLITINYRLGPLGFLAHDALSEQSDTQSSGNYGLLDKIAALQWVQRNAAAFGGDADNVTVFGQSAGSQSVCYLMTSPLARGLFHKAIGQSAACGGERSGDADLNGIDRGQRLVSVALGDNVSIEALRTVSPERLWQAAQDSNWSAASRIVIDGHVVPKPPSEAYAAGEFARVPTLVGSLADEGNELFPIAADLSSDKLRARLLRRYGARADSLLELYAHQLQSSPGLAYRDILTDEFMALGMRRWAGQLAAHNVPSYLYFFEHVPPAFRIYQPDNPDLKLAGGPRSGGAYHSGDLAYVFGSVGHVGLDWQDRDYELSQQIMDYWTNFARSGDPNGSGLPRWPSYESHDHSAVVFGARTESRKGVRREKLDALEG